MDHCKLHVSVNTPNKPSKILALFALIFAFSLPFLLVKTFPQKQKQKYAKKIISLPNHQALDKSIETTTVPINAAEIKQSNKTSSQQAKQPISPPPSAGWLRIKSRPRDTLTTLFIRAGLSVSLLQQILNTTPQAKLLTKIQTDQTFRFYIKNKQLEKLITPYSNTQYIVLSRKNSQYQVKLHSKKVTTHNLFVTATVHGSLYNTAKRSNIPPQLIRNMIAIFSRDINFSRNIHEGDHFTMIYKALYIKDKLVGTGDIIAVSYNNKVHLFQAVQHTDRSGHTDYYTPQGQSFKKAFNRYPIQFSHISSMFSLSRYHPILHYARPHKGVDLAARIGTPIHATGDGRIEIIGRQGGYGNTIKIKHSATYSSVYGHLLKFQKGLSRGSYVRIGQVIGYVGQSGLASGPHCHYEFHVNHQPRNPTTVQLPHAMPLAGKDLASLRAHAGTLLAQMKHHENAHIASRGVNVASR